MMAETIYYLQATISARNFYNEGKFGDIFYSESEYQHDGLQEFYFEYGKRKTENVHGDMVLHQCIIQRIVLLI
jgi:hypothetical protein